MSPVWWFTYLIISMYAVNSIWLASLGNYWAAGYWISAAAISVCAMMGLTR